MSPQREKGEHGEIDSIANLGKRGRMLLVRARHVAALLVAIAGFAIYRLRRIFGSHNTRRMPVSGRDSMRKTPAHGSSTEPKAHHDAQAGRVSLAGEDTAASAPDRARPQDQEQVSDNTRDTGRIKLPPLYDDSYFQAAWAAVPDIGSCRRRWYGWPYLILNWCVSSWRGKVVPRRLRTRIYRWITTLIRYNELDRFKAWSRDDPMHNVFVPEYEHVTVLTLWVVELFPPSVATELRTIVEKYDPSIRLLEDDEAGAILSQSRAGRGYDWFSLASIKDPASNRILPDSRIERLPTPFWAVELTAIQLGTGLTAVVARFHLTDPGASSLDRAWHRQHEPRLRRRGKQLIAESREFSAYGQTQEMRRQPHDLARDWMARHSMP